MNKLPNRLHSIDVFRAITMLLMIFVNDVSSVKNIPGWIEHVDAGADGLGFADTVFPAFSFIVGLSLPFAIRKRITRGDSFFQTAAYIISRSVALLVMGFFHVNGEEYSPAATLPRPVWSILTTLAFFLIWLDYPKGRLLILLSVLVLFAVINVSAHTGLLHFKIMVIGDASSVTLVMGGAVIAGIYRELTGKGKDLYLWVILIATGSVMIICGLVIRPYAAGISKIHSTPAWVFVCYGISILVFTGLIWLVDFKGKQNWFAFIRPGGTSTLTCYLIPYFLYALFTLIHFTYPSFLSEGAGGITRSFVIAFFVIGIVGVMEKYRLRLSV